jgi:hypothetical protein
VPDWSALGALRQALPSLRQACATTSMLGIRTQYSDQVSCCMQCSAGAHRGRSAGWCDPCSGRMTCVHDTSQERHRPCTHRPCACQLFDQRGTTTTKCNCQISQSSRYVSPSKCNGRPSNCTGDTSVSRGSGYRCGARCVCIWCFDRRFLCILWGSSRVPSPVRLACTGGDPCTGIGYV